MQDSPLVLVVEDEPKLARLLQDYLEQASYLTHHIDDGRAVEDWVRQRTPDLILLDLMLPGQDGMSVCRAIRAFSSVPIIMVTARVEEIDRLLGLELGADDYVCKPFSPREVVARVKALLRRVSMDGQGNAEVVAGFGLDEDRLLVRWDARELELTPVEFRLLKTLADQPGRVFSRDHLLDRIYTDNRVVTDRTVDSHIKNLRRKLKALAPDGQEETIRSVYGVGYKFAL